jgi:hypothetical protein
MTHIYRVPAVGTDDLVGGPDGTPISPDADIPLPASVENVASKFAAGAIPDATGATADDVPIADGSDGYAWGPQSGGGFTPSNPLAAFVPTRTTVNVKLAPYSAKGDGKVVFDGAMSNGSPDLACATSTPFSGSAATVGNPILVVNGAGAGVHLLTTIASITNTGHAVLAANCTNSSGVTGVGVLFGTADDTALGAAYAAVGVNGDVVIPDGIYVLAGQVLSASNHQLPISGAGVYGCVRTITSAKTYLSFGGASRDGAVILSLYNATPPAGSAVIGCEDVETTLNFTGALTVLHPPNPKLSGFDFHRLWHVDFEHLASEIAIDDLTNIPQPTNITAGFIGPGVTSGYLHGRRFEAIGHYVGELLGEGCIIDWGAAWGCYVGRALRGANHSNRETFCSIWHCKYSFAYVDLTTGIEDFPETPPEGSGYFLDVDTYDLEVETGVTELSWSANPIDVNDPTNQLRLTIGSVSTTFSTE